MGPPERPLGLRAGLVRNLTGGLSLLWLRRVAPERFVRTFDQALVLLLLDLLVWVALDRFHAEAGAVLQLDGLFGWAAYLLCGLFAGALIARVQDRAADTRALLIPALSVAPFLLLLLRLLADLPFVRDRPVLAVLIALAYMEFVGLRLLKAAYGWVRPRTALLATVIIIAGPFVLDDFGLDTRLWLVDDETAQDSDPTDVEGLLYDQPARIAAAVERMSPVNRGAAHMYFLGFAGVGEQAVFKREARYAEQVFADKFGTAERSVELINDDGDRESYPLATVSGLDQAVKLMAARMDPDKDVLVLMLTSHGSEDGLAISNGSLPLRQLGPADLREILDDAGIKWRIVIVSACYSGVFLDSLKSDTTLVVTAADADHSSFGCDDSRDLTWFGEAFLRDSLPGSTSFETAFQKAAALIQRREAAEHQIHSNPQLYMGAGMRGKLAGFQAESSPSQPRPPPMPRTRSGGTRTVSATIAACPRPNTILHPAPCRLRL